MQDIVVNLVLKTLNIWLSNFSIYERTWLMLFQKRIVYT